MSYSHKERHQWKDKERDKTGESDPAKIKLHRERFLKRIAVREFNPGAYQPVLFIFCLVYKVDEVTTDLFCGDELVETIPYLVENVSDSHNAIAQIFQSFDSDKEEERLRDHVAKIKATDGACHFEKNYETNRVCQCSINCQFRKWEEAKGFPICSR